MKGEQLTFHLGIKNGGWGLHRDEYEGYNRLSRKMGEATLVSLATQLGSRSHQSCVNAHLSQQGVDGGGTLSAATTGEAPLRRLLLAHAKASIPTFSCKTMPQGWGR